MSPSRLLTVLVVVQTLLLSLLVAERFVPVAHASDPVRCEVSNWPDALRGQGFDAIRVRVEEVKNPVPVTLQGVRDMVPVKVRDWDTSDRVRVQVDDWNTSDTVRVESR